MFPDTLVRILIMAHIDHKDELKFEVSSIRHQGTNTFYGILPLHYHTGEQRIVVSRKNNQTLGFVICTATK